MPAEAIPVVDVFLECEDFSGSDGLLLLESCQKSVGGRATGAAFGGEEFDYYRCAGGGWVALRGQSVRDTVQEHAA